MNERHLRRAGRLSDPAGTCALFFVLAVILLLLPACGYRHVRLRTVESIACGHPVSARRVRTVKHAVGPVGSEVWILSPVGWVRGVVIRRWWGWADVWLDEPAFRGWSGSPAFLGSLEAGVGR